jgi:RND family efflux transporter MFP subunit
MNSRILAVTLWAGAGVVMQGCGGGPSPSAAATSSLVKPVEAAVNPAPVVAKEFVASGPIVVENQVDVAAQREGVISRIVVDTGTRVRKGQLLATLDDRQLTAEHDAAEAKLRSIQADEKNWEAQNNLDKVDLQRAEKMMSYDLITKEELDHARYKVTESQYEAQRVKEDEKNGEDQLRALGLELEKTRISAPFDGIVARRYVSAGQKVGMGDRIFWVTAVAPLLVKFTLPEQFLGEIKKGDAISITVAESPKPHPAKVTLISPVVDPASDSIEVEAKLEGAPADLMPGMTAQVHLPNSKHQP